MALPRVTQMSIILQSTGSQPSLPTLPSDLVPRPYILLRLSYLI